jgi:hypothetical protein
MKGIRFYLEFKTAKDKRRGNHTGNVFAACIETKYMSRKEPCIEGFGSVYDRANSPCCYIEASLDYLRLNCKRISESQAREIHPMLFERMEM